MHYASIASGIAILGALLTPVDAAPLANTNDFVSRAAVIEWIDGYRNKPEPSRLPAAVKALSVSGALREPETAGYYVGFVAGVRRFQMRLTGEASFRFLAILEPSLDQAERNAEHHQCGAPVMRGDDPARERRHRRRAECEARGDQRDREAAVAREPARDDRSITRSDRRSEIATPRVEPPVDLTI